MVLGHLQRGGEPSSADRILAMRFGAAAAGYLARGTESGMVAMRDGEVVLVPLDRAAGQTRNVPTDRGLVTVAREIGIAFGDEAEDAFSAS